MSQVDYNVANADGATVRADINAQFDAIATNNSGGSAPGTTFANMWWFDTATNDLLQRNEANTAWVQVANKDPSTDWTPYRQGVALGVAAIAGNASLTAKGIVERATQTEVNTGSDDTRFITPLTLETKPAAGFPATTAMIFQQDAAPSGWTKQGTHDNKAIRLITGTVSSGGSNPFTTTFGTGKTTAAHTLTAGEIGSHAHDVATFQGSDQSAETDRVHGVENNTAPNATVSGAAPAAGGGGDHSHDLAGFDLQYVDFIICTKNA